MGAHAHERREFESEDEKWQQAALALIERAKVQSQRAIGIVDPQTVGLREEDYPDGKINPALKAAIDKELKVTNTAAASSVAEVAEVVEMDPRLTTFKADYDTSKNPKLKALPWLEIQTRLLADKGEQLKAALDLNEGGILFGVDVNGNPLICDRGDQAVMTGMNYPDTRDRVLYKHDSDQPMPTGYEIFPYVEPYEKSDEIMQYETHTGKPFVIPPNGENFQSSWAESGENPPWPRVVDFVPNAGHARIGTVRPGSEVRFRGVRRLLRVVKKA